MATRISLQSDIACPVNPEVNCPYRVHIDNVYQHRPTESTDSMVVAEAFNHDDRLRSIKLAEHSAAAHVLHCSGVTTDGCEVATQMQQSPGRNKAKRFIGRLLGRQSSQTEESLYPGLGQV